MPCYDCTPKDSDIYLVERPLGYIVELAGRVESFPFVLHENALRDAEDFISERHGDEAVWFCQDGKDPILHTWVRSPSVHVVAAFA